MNIGDSLKKLRESKSFTQQQMADSIHVHCYPGGRSHLFREKNGVLQEISVEDKATMEKLQLIKIFKDYLPKNISTL